MLFYAVVALRADHQGAPISLMVVLAWAVRAVARIVTCRDPCRPNKVRWRTPAFALGFLILAVMWLKLLLHVGTAGSP